MNRQEYTDFLFNQKFFDKEYFHSKNKSNYGDYSWDQMQGVLKQFQNMAVSLFPKEIFSVLDAGCAKGYLVEVFRRRGYQAFGFDVSEYAIEAGWNEFPKLYQKTLVDDLTNLGDGWDQYDLVIASETMEHIPDQFVDQAIDNLAQLSKKYLLLTLPLEENNSITQREDYQDHDKSHFSIKPRSYWEEKLFKHFDYLEDAPQKMGIWNLFVMKKK